MSAPLLVLVGPPASGKTTVGTAVAERSASPSATPTATSRPRPASSVADVFVSQGEPHFRALEQAASPAPWPSTTASWRSAVAR